MRLTLKSRSLRDSFADALRREGIRFEVRERVGYEGFVGYMLTGTLDEIEKAVEEIGGVDREALREGFAAFRESVLHVLEGLKAGEDAEKLLMEGSWAGDILDQLHRAGVLDYDGKTIKLKEGADPASLRFEFKFPFNLVHSPEEAEKHAKQFVFTDLLPEYEFEFLELDIGKINKLASIAGKYFPEEVLLKAYFALISRGILAGEILKALRDKRVPEEELVKNFVRAAPMAIPTQKGTLVINYSKEAVESTLRLLKRLGYVEIKAGKVRKLRDM
jgi:DNA-binding transcriptional ArsR family regulator